MRIGNESKDLKYFSMSKRLKGSRVSESRMLAAPTPLATTDVRIANRCRASSSHLLHAGRTSSERARGLEKYETGRALTTTNSLGTVIIISHGESFCSGSERTWKELEATLIMIELLLFVDYFNQDNEMTRLGF